MGNLPGHQCDIDPPLVVAIDQHYMVEGRSADGGKDRWLKS